MWFLECDGAQVFNKKRVWLRPGTQFLLGRTRPKLGAPGFYLEHSSVSRQHLLIAVDHVKAGDSARLHARSKLTLTDSSKLGTAVDGDKLSKGSKTLDKTEVAMRLGNYPDLFRIKWAPVTFSFTSLSKAARKKSEDPLTEHRSLLEPLDMKCVVDYFAQHTSHTVTTKRNTSAVLQALVNGRYVVTESYIQAVAAAGKRDTLDSQSLLELDFDAHWPRELDFLPPPGREPNPRPANSDQFLPKEARSEIFSRYTFIFHDQTQYDSLMPVVTGGGGKAVVRFVDPGETDVSEMVNFVRDIADKKGDTSFNLKQQINPAARGGIIIVRIGNNSVQAPGYYEKLDATLGQQSMEQNELLDAILDVDASKLKRAVDTEITDASESRVQDDADSRGQPHDQHDPVQKAAEGRFGVSPDRQSPGQDPAIQSQQEPARTSPEPLARRRAARQRATQAKYRGFEDFKPEASMTPYQASAPQEAHHEPSQALSIDPMEAEYPDPSQSQMPGTQRSATQRSNAPQSTRKRPGMPLEQLQQETHEDVMNGILKGATAMKRRKLEEQRLKAASQPQEEQIDVEDDTTQQLTVTKKPMPRRQAKELDVKALMTERREAEDEARRRDEENLRAAFDGMDVADIRNLALVEEMEIVRRELPPRMRYSDDSAPSSDRWDDRWNGRKNFKKFRRQRNGSGENECNYDRQRTRVIVPLEEVQKKAYGVGEDYWLESIDETRRKEKEKRASQRTAGSTTSQSMRKSPPQRGQTDASVASIGTREDAEDDSVELDDHDETRFRRRIRNSRIQDAEAADTEEIYPEEIAGAARDADIEAAAHEHTTATSRGSTSRSTTQKTTQTQTQARTQGTKRAAAAQPSGQSAPKRTRATGSTRATVVEDEDSDEEDALRFRRRRRG
ncbi:hypothetical protein AAFC00_002415 [Neodothiora populina]|uniref:FHA domain-containing protein n=1 Tax=Neodothiora populina TaxID=2781224 RepID=A0ABR3P758_9PEZI